MPLFLAFVTPCISSPGPLRTSSFLFRRTPSYCTRRLDATYAQMSAVCVLGGCAGYARNRSIPSLAAGITFGTVFLISGLRMKEGQPYGYETAAGEWWCLLFCMDKWLSTRQKTRAVGKCACCGLTLLSCFVAFPQLLLFSWLDPWPRKRLDFVFLRGHRQESCRSHTFCYSYLLYLCKPKKQQLVHTRLTEEHLGHDEPFPLDS